MKKLSFIFIFLCVSLYSLCQSYNNTLHIFNVKLFGAKGDGTTDDTSPIQAAINAANTANGGIVYFPNGVYIIGGALQTSVGGDNMNSQLYIPYTAASSTSRNHIKLLGEEPPNFTPGGGISTGTPVASYTSGVILKSTLTSGAASAAVIGTGLHSAVFNYTYLSVENMTIQVKNNPAGAGPVVGGISYKNGASLLARDVVVSIDTAGQRSTFPTNSVVGIETPDDGSETFNNLENTLVVGFQDGYKIGEHVSMNQAQAYVCKRGFNFKSGTHSSEALRILSQWCGTDIYVSGNTQWVNLQLTTEWQQASKWYDNVQTIKDSANQGRGTVFYNVIQAGVQDFLDTKFVKSGGTNIFTLAHGVGVAAITAANTFTATNTFSGTLTASSTTNLNGAVTLGNFITGFVASSASKTAVIEAGNSVSGTNSSSNFGLSGYFTTNTATPSNYAGKIFAGVVGSTGSTDGQAGGSATGFYTGVLGYGFSVYASSTPVTTYGVSAESQDKYGGTGSTLWNFYGKGVRSGGTAVSTAGGLLLDSIPTSRVTSGSPYGVKQVGLNQINFLAGTSIFGYNGGVNTSSQLQTTSFSVGYKTTAVDYTATTTDNTIEVTATAKTITLPTAVGIQGRQYSIKLTASGSGTVATTSSQNIDASTTYSLSAQYKYVTVESNGANWLIVANN